MMATMKTGTAAHQPVKLKHCLGASMGALCQNPTVSMLLIILSSYFSIKYTSFKGVMKVFLS